jgi:uncharacterized protein YbjT (DUF2867 family)
MNQALVIGGSGVLGSAVVKALREKGGTFHVGSRTPYKEDAYSPILRDASLPWKRMDLISGEGLAEGLAGVDTVFHLASDQRQVGNEPFEVVATRHLLSAAQNAGVKHLIYISIVGVDTIPFGYYQAKLAAEQMIQRSGVPYSILRATQFYPFIDSMLGKMLRFPIGFVPKKLKVQPIPTAVVAERLVAIAQHGPQLGVSAISGPAVLDFGTLAQSWMKQRNMGRPVLNVPVVGEVMRRVAQGDLTDADATTSSSTWFDYLTQKYPLA